MEFIKTCLKLCLIALLSAVMLTGYSYYYYVSPGPLSQEGTVLFKKGEGFRTIVDDMAAHGIIRQPLLFKAIAVLIGDARKFKPGEYHFTTAISPRLIMSMISEGRVVVHKLTIPEGLTVRGVTQLLYKEQLLEGDVSTVLAEGSLLPETYHFVYGDQRSDLIARMQAGMSQLLAQLWEKRKPGLPLATPQEALTLASIIEKETGVGSERNRVAAVFINRLRKGMKLQSDPTVAYGIASRNGAPLGRSLTLDDLRAPTPYNTYVIPGLPPGPIANPGRAALEAALNPADTSDLYFVATGTGGHNFAPTLEQHNRNVQAYRRAMQKQ